MNDLQMTEYGDLYFTDNDIVQTDSIRQQVLIKLRWFLGETQYGPDLGIDYWERVFVKNPNKTLILGLISEQIRSVDGVKSVTDLKITLNNKTRNARISFIIHTAFDDWLQEFDLYQKAMPSIYKSGEKLVFRNVSGQAVVVGDTLVIGDTVPTEIKENILRILGVSKEGK